MKGVVSIQTFRRFAQVSAPLFQILVTPLYIQVFGLEQAQKGAVLLYTTIIRYTKKIVQDNMCKMSDMLLVVM